MGTINDKLNYAWESKQYLYNKVNSWLSTNLATTIQAKLGGNPSAENVTIYQLVDLVKNALVDQYELFGKVRLSSHWNGYNESDSPMHMSFLNDTKFMRVWDTNIQGFPDIDESGEVMIGLELLTPSGAYSGSTINLACGGIDYFSSGYAYIFGSYSGDSSYNPEWANYYGLAQARLHFIHN